MRRSTGFGEENSVIDAIDRGILRSLEADARLSFKDLAERVGLSPNAVAERVRKLQERGVISGFFTQIDPGELGLNLRAIVEVKMESSTTTEQFEARAAAVPGVLRAMVTTGRYDWVLEVIARDQRDLQRIIEGLRDGGLTRDTYSRVIVSERRYPMAR